MRKMFSSQQAQPTAAVQVTLGRRYVGADGKVVDIHSLTNKSRSNLKKVEIDFSSHDEINLITTPVQIPDNLKTK